MPDVHPQRYLGLAAVATKRPLPHQDPHQDPHDKGILSNCFTVGMHVKQNRANTPTLSGLVVTGDQSHHKCFTVGIHVKPATISRLFPMLGVDIAKRVAEWAGVPLSRKQEAQLATYATWLQEEAIPAGGLGPREGEKLWGRHIADSLAFAVAWKDRPAPREILDVGSGVGLPGIPLGILWPDTLVTTLDRGGRRVRLLRRATRIVGLVNIEVAQGDVFALAEEWETVVYRGAVKAPEAVGLSARLLEVGGTAVLGLSRRPEEPSDGRDLVNLASALGLQAEVVEIPAEVLDATAWLLIMRLGD